MSYITDKDYEIAKRNGISATKVYNRVYQQGWDVSRAITEITIPKKNIVGQIKEKYPDWEERLKELDLTMYGILSRIKRGYTIDEAMALPRIKVGDHNRKSKGRISKKDVEIAKENGISFSTLKARVYKHKWPIKKAIHVPVDVKKRRKDGKV